MRWVVARIRQRVSFRPHWSDGVKEMLDGLPKNELMPDVVIS
jgi:hypothetical protein